MKTNILKLFIFSFGLLAMSCDKEENINEELNDDATSLPSEEVIYGELLATANVNDKLIINFIEHEPGVIGMTFGLTVDKLDEIDDDTKQKLQMILSDKNMSHLELYKSMAGINANPEYEKKLNVADKRFVKYRKDLESGKIIHPKPESYDDDLKRHTELKNDACPNDQESREYFVDMLELHGKGCDGSLDNCYKSYNDVNLTIGNRGYAPQFFSTIAMSGDGKGPKRWGFSGAGTEFQVLRGKGTGGWESVAFQYLFPKRINTATSRSVYKYWGYYTRSGGWFSWKNESLTDCRNAFLWYSLDGF